MVDKLRLCSGELGIYKQNNIKVNSGIYLYYNYKILINRVQSGKEEYSGNFFMKSYLFLQLIGNYFQMFCYLYYQFKYFISFYINYVRGCFL